MVILHHEMTPSPPLVDREVTVAYGGERHGRHGELWHFRETNFAAVAESMGALGITVSKANQLAGALEPAISHQGPAVVNVVTDMNVLPAKAPTTPVSRPPGRPSRPAS